MHRCAAPLLIDSVGAAADSIFWSALASASGFRVNCALIASARYSRRRLTAIASSCVTSGAMIQEMTQRASRIASSGPASFPRRPLLRTGSLPRPIIRPMPSRTSSTAPTRAASVVMRRTSRFFTWPSSCPMTPWSSSWLQIRSSPLVTAMCESRGS